MLNTAKHLCIIFKTLNITDENKYATQKIENKRSKLKHCAMLMVKKKKSSFLYYVKKYNRGKGRDCSVVKNTCFCREQTLGGLFPTSTWWLLIPCNSDCTHYVQCIKINMCLKQTHNGTRKQHSETMSKK